ncbi:MAG: hypothetical protein JWQ80_691 [Massilia sp.]|nr:hypothetical protein [Massilia sp.]
MSYKKLLAVLPCAALWAALPPKAGAQPQPQQGQQGMVVVRDAQTGQLRAPTPAEMRALAPPSASASMSAPSQPALVTHPGGSRHVRLGERGLVYTVVKRGADGKLDEQCVHGAAAAEKALAPSTSAGTAAAPHNEGHRHD